MSEYILDVVERHRSRGVVLDTNVLLLLIVGVHDRTLVSKHKRTQCYTLKDFDLLVAFVRRFKSIITSPNVLTEVSNLIGQASDLVKHLGVRIESMQERYTESREATKWSRFSNFGITDSVIALTAREGCLILTDDFKLAQTLEHEGLPVLNFNHVRDLARTL